MTQERGKLEHGIREGRSLRWKEGLDGLLEKVNIQQRGGEPVPKWEVRDRGGEQLGQRLSGVLCTGKEVSAAGGERSRVAGGELSEGIRGACGPFKYSSV